MRRLGLFLFGPILISGAAGGAAPIPTPQYYEALEDSVVIGRGTPVSITAGPAGAAASRKAALAAEFLRRELLALDPKMKIDAAARRDGASIELWDLGADRRSPIALNFLDREALSNVAYRGQGYVIRTAAPARVTVIGASEQGVLYGAMSLLQLLRKTTNGVEIPGVYIRDYPDFEWRAASDWLLRIELSHWALDRGQGPEGFERLCEQKLDRALRFKINMVLIDGFGWSLERRLPGYGEMMRRLNRYARERGIKLIYGGYGAAYDLARQPGEYLGEVFENRESYPDGEKYRCFGDPHQGEGSCRSNEELNRLKTVELRRFVETVEPGALYIHHEDCCAFTEFAKAWPGRCPRCRRRWPNDDFSAADGGAGAFAHGYSTLVSAINQVKKPDGYDAARDTEIILVSPVYQPNSPSSPDWSNMLALWENIAKQLPSADNLQICLREIFPQAGGSGSFVQKFNWAMEQARRPFRPFLFFIGGADNFLSDYPLTGAPAMNAMFLGAKSIYNATGDFYQEPMEVLNAEYSWNSKSTGYYRIPARYQEATDLRFRFIYEENRPAEIFGPGGLYERACELLYGAAAGPIMAAYYRESAWTPDRGPGPSPAGSQRRHTSYLPMMFDRIYAAPQHWLHLRADSSTWAEKIEDPRYRQRMAALGIEPRELRRRLARRWEMAAELNRKGAAYIVGALAASPLSASVEDLRFLKAAFRAYQPLLDALAQFHEAMELRLAGKNLEDARRKLEQALAGARRARQLAAESFPQPVDPMGADVGSLQAYAGRLADAIEKLL
ncbi:MAG: hypothetical protein KIT09_07580 [Bryobacteraceae bacterium]|nr:hypothetical protein [Bryobacteraceae bacterium]